MSTASKLKVSLTLPKDLVDLVDRDAREQSDTRSGVIERWLRRAASAHVEKELEEATAAYYRSLRGEGLAEERSMSKALSRAARRVSRENGHAPR
jgi:metal-responsive CopG/Arc/MetJ family transcriptional regulator